MERYIKIGNKTEKHAETLKKAGYEVTGKGDLLVIQAEKVLETADFSTEEKATETLKAAIAEKAVFSYTTRFDFGRGVLFGIPACTRMEKVINGSSALVTKGPKKEKEMAPQAAVSISDLF